MQRSLISEWELRGSFGVLTINNPPQNYLQQFKLAHPLHGAPQLSFDVAPGTSPKEKLAEHIVRTSFTMLGLGPPVGGLCRSEPQQSASDNSQVDSFAAPFRERGTQVERQ